MEEIKLHPLGVMPKKFAEKRFKYKRYNELCRAIADYFEAGLPISIVWVEEYNELLEFIKKEEETSK